MIKIKEFFNNGLFDCFRIYDDEFKILNKKTNYLYNTSIENTLVIPISKKDDYIESKEKVENK